MHRKIDKERKAEAVDADSTKKTLQETCLQKGRVLQQVSENVLIREDSTSQTLHELQQTCLEEDTHAMQVQELQRKVDHVMKSEHFLQEKNKARESDLIVWLNAESRDSKIHSILMGLMFQGVAAVLRSKTEGARWGRLTVYRRRSTLQVLRQEEQKRLVQLSATFVQQEPAGPDPQFLCNCYKEAVESLASRVGVDVSVFKLSRPWNEDTGTRAILTLIGQTERKVNRLLTIRSYSQHREKKDDKMDFTSLPVSETPDLRNLPKIDLQPLEIRVLLESEKENGEEELKSLSRDKLQNTALEMAVSIPNKHLLLKDGEPKF